LLYLALQEGGKARKTFKEALSIRKALDQPHLEIECLAGLLDWAVEEKSPARARPII
jgi:hypothetical protein